MLRSRIICLNEVYKLSVGHFLTKSIFYLLIYVIKAMDLLDNVTKYYIIDEYIILPSRNYPDSPYLM